MTSASAVAVCDFDLRRYTSDLYAFGGFTAGKTEQLPPPLYFFPLTGRDRAPRHVYRKSQTPSKTQTDVSLSVCVLDGV